MFNKIKNISRAAQQAIDSKLSGLDTDAQRDWQALRTCYVQLDVLIETAEQSHLLWGPLLLSYQLSDSKQELNAEILLRNFLKVIQYNRLDSNSEERLCIDWAKNLSILFFISWFVAFAAGFPLFATSFSAWVFLPINLLPLVITYACDDKPLSMSDFYTELAFIEKTMAEILIITFVYIALSLLSIPAASGLMISIALIGVISLIGALFLHQVYLDSKSQELNKSTEKIQSALENVNVLKDSRWNFFKNIHEPDSYNSTRPPFEEMQAVLSGLTSVR